MFGTVRLWSILLYDNVYYIDILDASVQCVNNSRSEIKMPKAEKSPSLGRRRTQISAPQFCARHANCSLKEGSTPQPWKLPLPLRASQR